MISWNAPRGTAMKVAVSGEVALTRSNVDTKTEKEPIAPHQIMNQKKGTSRYGRLWKMFPSSPDTRTMGVRMIRERSDV